MPAKNMPGRKAGEDHARSQCCLRQEAILKPVCCRRPVRLRLASLASGEASSASRATRSAERWKNSSKCHVASCKAVKSRERTYSRVRFAQENTRAKMGTDQFLRSFFSRKRQRSNQDLFRANGRSPLQKIRIIV